LTFAAASITQKGGGSEETEERENVGNGTAKDQYTVPRNIRSKSNACESAASVETDSRAS